jgi:hypothetical protein
VIDRIAQHVQGPVEPLHLLVLEVRSLPEGGKRGLPQDLIHPGAADACDHPLVAEHRMQVAGLAHLPRQLLGHRRGPGLGAERGHHLVGVGAVSRHQLRPRSLLGAELAQPELAAVGEADEDPRAAVPKRGALVEQLQSTRRHQMDQHRERCGGLPVGREPDQRHLADPPDTGDPAAGDCAQRRLDRLDRDHSRGERRLHPDVAQPRVEAAGGDLDLGQLGHRSLEA